MKSNRKWLYAIGIASLTLCTPISAMASVDDVKKSLSDIEGDGGNFQISECTPYDGSKFLRIETIVNADAGSDVTDPFFNNKLNKFKEMAQQDWFDYNYIYEDVFMGNAVPNQTNIYDFSQDREDCIAWGDGGSIATYKISDQTILKQSGPLQDVAAADSSQNANSDDGSNVITVGGSFETDNLKVTLNNASTDFQDYNNEYGMNTPADGMKYVMASFTFENVGKSDAYASIYDFSCYADNQTCEEQYGLDDSDFMTANLSPGRNVSFNVYFAVPINAQSIELEYTTDMWTGEKAIIKLQ